MMRILVLGSGGREHALCWKIAQSSQVERLYAAPGNDGIAALATCVALDPLHAAEVTDFCREQAIDLVVIGPETPLVAGIGDHLRRAGFAVFGPSAAAARLEGSKSFTKALCAARNIPTAAYGHFTDAAAAKAYIRQQGAPIVVKADGLAAGKGVTVAMQEADALAAVDDIFGGAFGEGGSSVVIEEYLEGEEVSFFALADGVRAIEFGSAQDHKRAGEGDTGPNTGGMGAYSPAPVMDAALRRDVMARIIQPTVDAMAEAGAPYRGVLFAGLILTRSGPKLLEYNARFGDPETQALLPRLEGDIVPLLMACAQGSLEAMTVRMKRRAALCVVMAAKGYPGSYRKGTAIAGLEQATGMEDTVIFHAGTRRENGTWYAAGGRVLGVTGLGEELAIAQRRAYEAVARIDWPDGFYRRDIGWRTLKNEPDQTAQRCPHP